MNAPDAAAAGRSSGRVVEPPRNDLVSAPEPADKGADGRGMLAHSHARSGRAGSAQRISQQRLVRLKSSLSDRQLAVLTGLGAAKFSAVRQLERWHYHGSGLSLLSAARTARRELHHLVDQGLLERLDRRVGGVRAGSASFVYTLSPLGSRLLGETTRRRSRQPSLAHLDHVLQVGELIVQLHEAARSGALELLDVQGEPDCWRPLLGPHGARVTLKPDLRVTLGVGKHELHWFVEVDRGSEHRPVLTRKCAVYLSAWRDGHEQAEAGVFPRVLWIVPDDARAAVMRSVCASLEGVPGGMFVVCTETEAVTVLAEREVSS